MEGASDFFLAQKPSPVLSDHGRPQATSKRTRSVWRTSNPFKPTVTPPANSGLQNCPLRAPIKVRHIPSNAAPECREVTNRAPRRNSVGGLPLRGLFYPFIYCE